jgi:tRNA(Leu) C34 or U34 (ribose-2'-O)-methylase TrmL
MRGYAAIGLINPKTPSNVGGVARAMGCYEASMLAISGARFKRHATDTTSQWRHRPVITCDNLRDIIPFDCVPVAVDLIEGARPLHTYTHPERAFYIFGPEDSTIGKEVHSWCRDVIYVPTNGCMNLAATVNVILYDRQAKQLRDAPTFRRAA